MAIEHTLGSSWLPSVSVGNSETNSTMERYEPLPCYTPYLEVLLSLILKLKAVDPRAEGCKIHNFVCPY